MRKLGLRVDMREMVDKTMAKSVRIGILGASGYTGAELVRLLQDHEHAQISWLTAERNAGQPIGALFPHLSHLALPDMVTHDAADKQAVDVIFCCLPHGLTQEMIKSLPRGPKIIDLSADFRLRDPALYEATYHTPHKALDLQKEAVYGLSEYYREKISQSWLVANPGCYTTAAELPLLPLLKAQLIEPERIVIDAKSGVSGAGRSAKVGSLFTEVHEGFHAYAVVSHRHGPEIEQCLSDFSEQPVQVTFVPHLVPMNRGILATLYVRLKGCTVDVLQAELTQAYAAAPFVDVLPIGSLPATRHVRGTNRALIAVHPGRRSDEAVLLSVIDNLVKGASGQAIQNMNIMLGLDETCGLRQIAAFP